MRNIIKIILIFSFVSSLNASSQECYLNHNKEVKIQIQLTTNNKFIRVIYGNTRVSLKKLRDVTYQTKDKTMAINYYGNRLDMFNQSTNGTELLQFTCK